MAGGTPSGAGGSVAGRTNEPSRVQVTWTALLDAIALPLCTAQEQLAHGDFSCCESDCEDCEAHSLQQASEMASPMMSPVNAQKAMAPITANRRLEARNRIELPFSRFHASLSTNRLACVCECLEHRVIGYVKAGSTASLVAAAVGSVCVLGVTIR
jgi:hypothetical protein